jgi:hypothetical protein
MEDRTMKKISRLPHEERTTGDSLPTDGLPADFQPTDSDVEGHLSRTSPDQLGSQLPGTGGDFRRPSDGGELSENDVEGHDR